MKVIVFVKATMKYILLVYGAEDAWTEQECNECMVELTEPCHDLAELPA